MIYYESNRRRTFCSRSIINKASTFLQHQFLALEDPNVDICYWSKHKTLGNYQNVPKVCMKKDASIMMFLRVNLTSIKWILEVVSMNFRAMNQFCCALIVTEFYELLVFTYEGTSQVKKNMINILMHQYKKFKMKPNENINEMSQTLLRLQKK